MKINYKLSLLIMLFGAVVISSNYVYAQGLRNDTLYFCEEYKDSKEIGNADEFYLPEKGGTITVMLRTKKPVGVAEIFLQIEKDVAGIRENISKEPFDVQASWDYIFFADIFFPEPGKYRVMAVKKNGDMIASGYVRMLKNK
ncbi:MAG: hypothetical protein HOP31_04530 [Ignavibacteria bacterium]|nr:hypothetical protein [Ignavibacteria bacterium]